MAKEKALPTQGARALYNSLSDANAMVIKSGKRRAAADKAKQTKKEKGAKK